MTRPYRVALCGTGNVGSHALRLILERDDLELVVVRVYNPAKVGRDAGELIGAPAVGVLATDDTDSIIAAAPDCVVYHGLGPRAPEAPPNHPLGELCGVLRAGCNVLTSSYETFVHSAAAPPPVEQELTAATEAGASSFYASGANPGFNMDVWPVMMSRLCHRIDSIYCLESLDMRRLSSRPLMDLMGFGSEPDAPCGLDRVYGDGRVMTSSRYVSMRMRSDAFGATLGEITYRRDSAVAHRPVETSLGTIEVGAVVGQRITFTAPVNTTATFIDELVWWVDPTIPLDWPLEEGWILRFDGDPAIELTGRLHTNHGNQRSTSLITAAQLVNAIPVICDSPPGVYTGLDLPPYAGGIIGSP